MSAPLFGSRPVSPDAGDHTTNTGMSVSSRLIRLEQGLFGLSLLPGPASPATGLPAVRVSLPPGPAGRRETVSVSTFRSDGWMAFNDEATLLRVLAGGGEVLVTLYWSSAEAGAVPPPLRLVRLNPDGPIGGVPAVGSPVSGPADTPRGAAGGPFAGAGAPFAGAGGPLAAAIRQEAGTPAFAGQMTGAGAPRVAEVVAHIEGVGDVDGRLGEWIGLRGSGRAIEGFSLTPRLGISPDDFEVRAVLGRDWLSPWLPGGSFCGSRGLALPMRGFCLRLHPAAAARFELVFSARFVDGTDVGPITGDRPCASPNLAALEAFQVQLRPRMG